MNRKKIVALMLVASLSTPIISQPLSVHALVNKEVDLKIDGENKTVGDISVGVQVVESFKTYTDPVTNIEPTEITVSIPVSISKAGIQGARIEIPYGFIPDNNNQTFKHFTMTDPIFTWVDPGVPAQDSIVESYQNDINNQKLIINLKNTKQTVETLNLKFRFNQDYNAKIPENQIIWENLQAIVFQADGTQISQSNKVNIKADTRDGMSVTASYSNPTNQNYIKGTITTRIWYRNDYNKYSLLDLNAIDNEMFLEVPTDSEVKIIDFNSFFDFNNGKTNADDNSIPNGYTRYYRKLTDDQTSFPFWSYGGNINSNMASLVLQLTPKASYDVGDKFHVSIGMSYTKINGSKETKVRTIEYVQSQQEEWELTKGLTSHNTGDSSTSDVIINDPNSVSRPNIIFGRRAFDNRDTVRNTGKRSITGTKFELYQNGSEAEKVNFNEIEIVASTDVNAVRSYYKTDFEITNAISGITRMETGGVERGRHTVNLPTLQMNEYISKVTITPMGIDGKTEGDWPSGNGFGVTYSSKNWVGNKWPNGTTIPMDRTSTVMLNATMFYNDEEGGKQATPTSINMDQGNVYYRPASTQASAHLVSGDSIGRSPGDTVTYRIQGYNKKNAVGDWENPEISIAIPKVLELENPNELKDYIDIKNNQTHSKKVRVTKVSSDNDFNYYRFKVDGTGFKNGSLVSFEIPLKFKVVSGALEGRYPIKAVAVSGDNFIQFDIPTNNLSDDLAKAFGYDNSKLNSYTGVQDGHSDLEIIRATKLEGETSARGSVNDAWSSNKIFAVDKKGTPQMNAIISNTGNTSFESIRLYDILPSTQDGRGSTGAITFKGLENALPGTKVYYTTQPVSQLPKYDTDLQTWDDQRLQTLGFTTVAPADISAVTAIYIDFDKQIIAPNQNLESVLNFLVPDADNQKAINQFQYSAKEVGTSTVLNASSDFITFSTEIAKVSYDENLPQFLLSGIDHATDIPNEQSILLDAAGLGKIKLSDNIPSLPGYRFVKWVDTLNNNKEYNPGDIIDFNNPSNISLKAVWEAIDVNVVFKKNDGSDTTIQTKTYKFGDTIDLSQIGRINRDGYNLQGWSTSAIATTPDFVDGIIDFISDKTVYAIWEANEYEVKFDTNGGVGTIANQSFTYDVKQKLTKNTFVKEGHTFKGWATDIKGTVKYIDEQVVSNLTTQNRGTVILYAVWNVNAYKVNYDSQGGSPVAEEDVEFDTLIKKPTDPTKEGYTFGGWYKDVDCTIPWDFDTDKMPSNNLTLYAKWNVNAYKVNYDSQGGSPVAEEDVEFDTLIKKPTDPTKEGYTFGGWYKDVDCTIPWDFDTDKMPSNNLTL
ncbi:InlB B-repeat-containing protein, partial [Clostridium tertium]|uniref:InlB B-repeat-containing protein n=2 Tax=Clostridium tertium TaxID=1559 RepID=UPI00374E96BE